MRVTSLITTDEPQEKFDPTDDLSCFESAVPGTYERTLIYEKQRWLWTIIFWAITANIKTNTVIHISAIYSSRANTKSMIQDQEIQKLMIYRFNSV